MDILYLLGVDNKYAPISWKSVKLKRVVRSTLAAETLALEEALEASFFNSIIRYGNYRFTQRGISSYICYC